VSPEGTAKTGRRFRPFRVAVYGLYLAVVVAFSVLVTVSVVGSVLRMSPGQRPSVASDPTDACRFRAESLWQELETQRKAFTSAARAQDAGLRWTDFRTGWIERLREAQSRCLYGPGNRDGLRRTFDQLERVL